MMNGRKLRLFSHSTPLLTTLLVLAISMPSTNSQKNDREELGLWIGQMIMVGFRGTELEEGSDILAQIRELHLGGVILFDYDVPARSDVRNILSAAQVRTLVARLQSSSDIPLFVAIDQEGGRIARLKPSRGFPQTLSQQELGRMDSEKATRENARRIAHTLRELGINVNFAPVLDLAVNPENPVIARLERSFGADPDLVARHAHWSIEEFHDAGILCAVKHFPGHGSSLHDSHRGLPDVTRYWDPSELKPFQILVAEKLPDMVMTAHLFNRSWDPDLPATLSRNVLQGMLRDSLDFRGIIVSDDLQMRAIVDNFSFERSIQLAIDAGIDILLVGNNQDYDPSVARRVFRIIRDMVERGDVTLTRIRDSYDRIRRAKDRWDSPNLRQSSGPLPNGTFLGRARSNKSGLP